MAKAQARRASRKFERAAKRALDVTLGCLALVLAAPLLLVTTALIKLDSSGPILFARPVTGRAGKPFVVYKFRTMIPDAHARLMADPELFAEYQSNLKVSNDPRVTRVGRVLRKTSIDELPQLVNVIRGEMSLVGPRMLGDVELERYGRDKWTVLSCKPGLTGLWQVNGRQSVSFERRRELELAYVQNWSLRLDFSILIRTVPAVLSGVGAN
jgi:lipopolysaccharide/colanic/teichoic acid biosynthesis glycosyltransferase